jgi:hypothetical protein
MSQEDSQLTVNENDDVDEPTQSYVDCTQPEGYVDQDDRIGNWPHEHQPGWSQYSDISDISRVPCSLSPSLSMECNHDDRSKLTRAEVLVPETPESIQGKSVARRVRPVLSKKEAEEQIKRVTEYLEQLNYTVFTHDTAYGNHSKRMHLGFFMYEESDESGERNGINDSDNS